MFWLGLCAVAGVGACFGLWSVVLADGVRCRTEGYPNAREAVVCPAYIGNRAWFSLPFLRLFPGSPDRATMFGIVLIGAIVWMYTWWLYWHLDTRLGVWAWNTVFASWLVFLGVLDYRWRILPIELMVGAGIIGLLVRWLAFGDPLLPLLQGMVFMAAFFGIQTWLSRGQWLGAGDPVMAGMMGAVLGWPVVMSSVYFTYMAVVPLLFLQMARVGTIRRVRWPFGPLLAFGGIASLRYGELLYRFFLHSFG